MKLHTLDVDCSDSVIAAGVSSATAPAPGTRAYAVLNSESKGKWAKQKLL